MLLRWCSRGENTLLAPLCSLSNTERFSLWLPVRLRSAEASRWPFSAGRPLPLAALSRGLKAIGSRFLRSDSSRLLRLRAAPRLAVCRPLLPGRLLLFGLSLISRAQSQRTVICQGDWGITGTRLTLTSPLRLRRMHCRSDQGHATASCHRQREPH